MHVEIITDTYAPDINGVSNTLQNIVCYLERLGHTVHIHAPAKNSDENVTNYSFLPLPFDPSARFVLPKARKLRKRWRKNQPDAVYIATETPFGYSALKVAKSMGIKVITGFHTRFDDYVRRHGLEKLQKPTEYWLSLFHNSGDGVVTPSRESKEVLESFGVKNIHLMERGVNTRVFNPNQRDNLIRGDKKIMLYVGRLAKEKNLELLFECYEKNDCELWVVGDGPMREHYEKLYPEVRFFGFQQGAELAKFYASCDVFVFPSESETFGNVLLEALACGAVTVSYDYAASDRYVNETNGFKTSKGDKDAFISLVTKALGEKKGPLDEIRSCAVRTVKELSWESVAQRFIEILGEKKEEAGPYPKKCKTLFVSDLHLGSKGSQSERFVELLDSIECETLVLNGDIIDGWALRAGGKWRKSHAEALSAILNKQCKKVYVIGNHDDFLDDYKGDEIKGVNLCREYIHNSNGKKYLVVHGDGLDMVVAKHRWLARLGSLGYDFLLTLNRWHYKWLKLRGRKPYSLSKFWKKRVKHAVQFVGRYEEQVSKLAESKGCDGVIVGHIHTPEDRIIGNIRYLNTGDWVESLSFVTEGFDGVLRLHFVDLV